MVIVVPPVVQTVVPVEVMVVDAVVELPLGVVVGAADDVEEATLVVDDSTRGVQLGRVKVGELPDPPSTMQFFAHAAVPLVVSG